MGNRSIINPNISPWRLFKSNTLQWTFTDHCQMASYQVPAAVAIVGCLIYVPKFLASVQTVEVVPPFAVGMLGATVMPHVIFFKLSVFL